MKKCLISVLWMGVLALSLLHGGAARAGFPERPMTWIVPLAAGGPTDAMTRSIAKRISEELNATILIENVTGAGGTIGAMRAASSPNDSYHFLVGHMGFMAAAPSLYKNLRYDPVKDFEAVIRFPDSPVVLLVPTQSPFRTASDLIEYAKANPGKVNFGTSGVGSMSHLAAELFAAETGVEIITVPYRGNAPAMADLVAGRLDAIFDLSNTALANVKAGWVRPLGVASKQPMEQFEGAPTLDSVIPGFEAVAWFGLYAPAGTAREHLELIEQAYLKALQDKAFETSLFDQGLQLLPPEDYRGSSLRYLTIHDAKRWAEVVRRANLQPQ